MTVASTNILESLYGYLAGTRLSERFKAAFRVALAMLLTYAFSMYMDWDKPFWAALSVIFCSLATAGESVNSGIDRIKGTAVAAMVALLIMAAFPHDRWLFLFSISLFTALCSYRMAGGSPRKAIWFNAGFNLPIIAILGEMNGPLVPATFDMAILRVQQTALGAVMYSLVAVLVWPKRGDEDFVQSVRNIVRGQQQFFSGYIDRLVGTSSRKELDKTLASVASQLPLLGAKLEGAAYDSLELRLVAGTWGQAIQRIQSLHMAFERWRVGFVELEGLEVRHYIPDWDRFVGNVNATFEGIRSLLSDEPAVRKVDNLKLPLNEDALSELSYFQRAAVISCRDQLISIASLASALFEDAHRITRAEPRPDDGMALAARPAGWALDPDRLATTVRQSTALWLSFLFVIYVPSVPIAVGLIALTNAFSMALGQLPQAPPTVLLKPVVMGALLGGCIYMLIMPQLSGFAQFGTMLFLVTFAIAYRFSDPQAALVRGLWLTMIVIIISAQNEQSYSVLVFGNWFLVGVMFVLIMIAAWHFPISFRAEDRFQAMLKRYLSGAAFLLEDLSVDRTIQRRHLYRWRRNASIQDMTMLPPRIRAWSTVLPPVALGETDREQLGRLLDGLELFSYRLQDLRKFYPQTVGVVRFEPLESLEEALRQRLADALDRMARDPGVGYASHDRTAPRPEEEVLAQRIETALDEGGMSRDDSQRLYQLLGAYRGLLDSFRKISFGLENIDWQRLREARI